MDQRELSSIAAGVIAKANRERPADAVLRTRLKEAKNISRVGARIISRGVFAYYRWLGWLEKNLPVEQGIQRALELDAAFQKNSRSIPETELRRAVPDWIAGEMEISADWLRSLQAEPNLWLRAQPGGGNALAERLGESWVGEVGLLADAVRFDGTEDLFRSPEFHAGEFEVQDISSQAVGALCDPQPGETWWDACAGEGGKALHLSALMGNKGLIWASDRAEWRLRKLKQRTARAKVFNYRAALWDGGAKLPTKTKFDGVLVDAPCSGVGTWQRNPHARWTTSANDVRELAELQLRLLTHVVPALKPGGRLIYSVCTLTRAETESVASALSQCFPELEPLLLANPLNPKESPAKTLWLWPQVTEGNGMFICGWKKPPLKPKE